MPALLALLTSLVPLSLFVTNWPVVQPFHDERTISLEDPTRDTAWVFMIQTNGPVTYHVECHTGEYEGTSLLNINYSGTYQCTMSAKKGEEVTSWNLFADDTPEQQTSDENNRGRLLDDNLRDSCADFPEYGAVRHFRLRGFLLTMRFRDLKWSSASSNSRLTRFTIAIDVRPEPSAQSPMAERVLARPPDSCLGIQR